MSQAGLIKAHLVCLALALGQVKEHEMVIEMKAVTGVMEMEMAGSEIVEEMVVRA